MFDLQNKVALVTGGASGIGLAYTKELLRNNLKAVAIIDINEIAGEKALEELGNEFGKERVIFIKTDVSDAGQLDGAFQATIEAFNQIDILINNAGIIHEIEWEKCIAVNMIAPMKATFLAVKKYFPKYKSSSEAVILNTSSIMGINPCPQYMVYSTSKAGLVAFARAMALTCAQDQIKIITICPSVTKTEIFKLTEEQVSKPLLSATFQYLESVPYQTAEAVAQVAVDLIKKANTGTVWHIQEGRVNEVEFIHCPTTEY